MLVSRLRLRLIAMVALVTYVASCAHAMPGICAAMLTKHAAEVETASAQESPAPSFEPARVCSHCAKRQVKVSETSDVETPETSCEETLVEDGATPCHESNSSGDDSCPCCPKSPGDKPCPFPGGCVYCNAAKIPCMAAPPISFKTFLFLGESCRDLAILYISPTSGCLIRPPKI